jgi:transposase-like protein
MSKPAVKLQPTPEPEEKTRRERRFFSAEYKVRILAECDAAVDPGKIGAILRREGLYSSHLVDWRRRRAEAAMKGLAPKKVGRPPKDPTVQAIEKENERLRRELAAVQERLRRSEIIIEAQKKLATVLDSIRSLTGESSE